MLRYAYALADVSRALGGDGRSTGRCPVHSDSNPSLSLTTGRDGQPKVHCFAGCDWRNVLAELEARGLVVRDGDEREPDSQRHAPTPKTELEPAASDRRKPTKRAARIWKQTRPISENDPVGGYLAARRCALPAPGADLQWLPPNPPRHPMATMVARVSAFEDASRGRTLHFTPVCDDGTRGERRLMAGLPSTGVVRRIDDADAYGGLLVAEGVETALSGQQPAFACLNAGNLAELAVLAGFECLTIAVDDDPAGRQATPETPETRPTSGVSGVTGRRSGGGLEPDTRRHAKRKAAQPLIGGVVHLNHANGQVKRITYPGTLRLRQCIAEQALRLNRDIVLVPVSDSGVARVLALNMLRGARAFIDPEFRLACTADWIAGQRGSECKRAVVDLHVLPRLDSWCRTNFLGELKPTGRPG